RRGSRSCAALSGARILEGSSLRVRPCTRDSMRIWSLLAAVCLALPCAGLGCRLIQPRQPMPAVIMLNSADWEVRYRAAVALAEGVGPPTEAVPPLYRAMFKERNPQVYGAMLIALGASGISEARPLIDARINDPDADMQQSARTALRRWLVRNLLLGED